MFMENLIKIVNKFGVKNASKKLYISERYIYYLLKNERKNPSKILQREIDRLAMRIR